MLFYNFLQQIAQKSQNLKTDNWPSDAEYYPIKNLVQQYFFTVIKVIIFYPLLRKKQKQDSHLRTSVWQFPLQVSFSLLTKTTSVLAKPIFDIHRKKLKRKTNLR